MSDLNFFTEYIEQRKTALKKTTLVYILIAVVLLSVISSYAVTELIVGGIEKEITEMNDFLNDAQTVKQLQEIDTIKKKLEILSTYSEQLDACMSGIKKLDVIKSALLEALNATLPGDVAFKTLDYTQNSISLKGNADARITVAELSYNLNALGIFTEVHVSKISDEVEGSETYTFEAACKLRGVID